MAATVSALCLIAGGAFFVWVATLKTPDLTSFETRRIAQSTKIYDRTGERLLYDIHENIRRTVVPISGISRHIKNATVAIEDSEFYEHRGIQPKAILRAILVNAGALSFSQGGSTITQQVVKNSLLTTEKKISRKLKEWILSLKLERAYNKETILGYYLNESPYGGNIYGVEEAALVYFGKRAGDVTVAEAAYLAALPKAPTFYSPYGNHRDKLEERKNLVLGEMKRKGFLSDREYEIAAAEKVTFRPPEERGIQAPHFVIFIKEYLEEKYGEPAVRDGGFKVITTLDSELQTLAEGIVKKFALENEEKFNAENAALVAIDPKTGDILAMVGSRDYFDREIDGNFNVALARRQPGSAFKPFVYATAFRKGYTPETVLFDLETEFSTRCRPDGTPIPPATENDCYRPINYDGKFRGPITLREALAQSVNIPAIKVLYLAGIPDSLETAREMGITTLADPNRYGLTLVLGGGEVTLLEMTSAYGVFAAGGIRHPYRGILKVEDSSGKVIDEPEPASRTVLDENIALTVSDILSDEKARSPVFGERSFLYIPDRQVAVKTGTTNDYRDAWIIGYTPSLSVGAWAGNNDNSAMEKKVAGFIVSPMWNAFMREALQRFPAENFKEPPQTDQTLKPVLRGFWRGNTSYFVDKISGKLATDYTPLELRLERVVTNVHSILYWIDKNNPRGDKPTDPNNDPQFERWEYAVQNFVRKEGIMSETDAVIPKENDDIHRPEFRPRLTIKEPQPGTTLNGSSRAAVVVNSTGRFPVEKVEIFINDQYAGRVSKPPFIFYFLPAELPMVRGDNTLKIVGYDSVLNRGETTIPFRVSFD